MTLETLIKEFVDNNQKVDWGHISIKLDYDSIYNKSDAGKMLKLCDRYNVPFPEMICYSKTGDYSHYYYIRYGYLHLDYDYTFRSADPMDDSENCEFKDMINECIDLCGKYDKKLKMSFELINLMLIASDNDAMPFADDITTTGEDTVDNIVGSDISMPAFGNASKTTFAETRLNAFIQYVNNNATESSIAMLVSVFKEQPKFNELKKIIATCKSLDAKKKVISAYILNPIKSDNELVNELNHDITVSNVNNIFEYLIEFGAHELLRYVFSHITNLSEDTVINYISIIKCKKTAIELLKLYDLDKINYKIIKHIMSNKNLGINVMTDVSNAIDQNGSVS